LTQGLVSSSKNTDNKLSYAFKLEKEKRICNQKNSVQMADPTPIVHYVGPCESNSLHEGTILWHEHTHKCVFEQQAFGSDMQTLHSSK